MREMKFRAWDKKSKSFVVGDRVGRDAVPTIDTKYGFKLKSRFILMQSIDLKDKNGKEIFEEDLCKAKRKSDGEIIVFTAGMVHAYVDWFEQPFEVIGNLHENPELSEDKE